MEVTLALSFKGSLIGELSEKIVCFLLGISLLYYIATIRPTNRSYNIHKIIQASITAFIAIY